MTNVVVVTGESGDLMLFDVVDHGELLYHLTTFLFIFPVGAFVA